MKKRPWMPAELDYLREHYALTPMREMCAHLGRSAPSVMCKAIEIGLRHVTGIERVRLLLVKDKSPLGLSTADIYEALQLPRLNLTHVMSTLVRRGQAHTLGHAWSTRYVATEERKAECEPAHKAMCDAAKERSAAARRERRARAERARALARKLAPKPPKPPKVKSPRTVSQDRPLIGNRRLVADAVARCTDPTGATAAWLREQTGLSDKQFRTAAADLVAGGRMWRLGTTYEPRYFATAEAQAAAQPAYEAARVQRKEAAADRARARDRARYGKPGRELVVAPKTQPSVDDAAKKRWKDMEPIVPAGVKVTVCPSGTDSRYSFQPPPGWVGEFTRQWMEQRNQTGHARLMKGRK